MIAAGAVTDGISYSLLLAPEGLSVALDSRDLTATLTADLPEVVNTLQDLSDRLHWDYPGDVSLSNLRASVFALTVLTEGTQHHGHRDLLRKIAGQLKTVPREIFSEAARFNINSRSIRFASRTDASAIIKMILKLKKKSSIGLL